MSVLQRNIGQKVALVSAIICLALVVPVISAFFWLLNEKGMANTWTPSALTTAFFLAFCAIVLYVMSRPKPPLPPQDAAVDG